MNKNQRNELKEAIRLIEEAISIVTAVQEGEQEKFDNLPDGLQATENNQKLEENACNLDDIVSELESQALALNEFLG